MTEPFTIYGDSLSGNCLKAVFVADRLNIPYTWIETRVLHSETRTPEFLAINPAGQVPVVRFADGRLLAQSNAIMLYLAEGSDLIPADPYQRALMFQWLFWEQYSHETAIAVLRFQTRYLGKSEADIDLALRPKSRAVLSLMNQHLGKSRYFVGDRLTLADIALVAYTRLSHEAGLDLAEWPAVRDWVGRVERDLGLTPLVPA